MNTNQKKQVATIFTAIGSILLSSSMAIYFDAKMGNTTVYIAITVIAILFYLAVKVLKDKKEEKHD